MMARQPPPVAPRSALQSWKQTTSGVDERYTNSSNDSRDSSSSEGSNRMSDLSPPSKTLGKTPPRNPLQFVKVQSPLYNKVEQQEKIPKEDKVPKEALKEGEEEWQSKLDNWKSRRRKVTEKVLQRAEEMRQIEIKEQLSQEHQKKIKKFSEIMGKKSTRSYSLSLYIDEKDDSGLGATPEPDDTLDSESSPLPSDTSEGRVSDAEFIENNSHKTHKTAKKEPPKVPQKTYGRLMKSASISYDSNPIDSDELFQHCVSKKDLNNGSPPEPYDVESSAKGPHDTDAAFSSEEDTEISNQTGNTDSGIESLCDNRRGDLTDNLSDLSQDSSIGMEKNHKQLIDLTSNELEEDRKPIQEEATDIQMSNEYNQSFKICLKRQESKELDLNGEKDDGNSAYIENVIKDYINTEIKITESRKGKSFAEKLAIFTAGVNAPTVFTGVDEPKAEKMETKKESLVLRRRSAFENRNSAGAEKVLEKRHSVDFMLGQNVIHENNVNKKGPPPPVPVKPKIKSKSAYFDPNKSTLSTTGTNGNISFPDCRISSSDNHISTSQEKSGILPVCSESFKSNFRPKLANLKQSSINEPTDSDKMHVSDISLSEQSELNICTESNDPFSNRNHTCLSENVAIPNSDLDEVGDQTTDKDFASFEANELEFKRDSSKQHVLETIDEMQSFCNNNKDSSSDIHEDESYKDSYEQDSNIGTFNDKICTGQNGSTNEISVTFVNNLSIKEYPIDFLNDTHLEACPEEIFSETPSEILSNPSAYNSACDNEDVNKSHVSECHDIQEPEVFESKSEVQANPSPLCLSLEKIDEDDVVSASTTTSSDTPDTETVIETLPSNVSPLPNDESNGEDSSKLPNFLDEESENVLEATETNEMSSSETNDYRENVENYDKENINSKEEISQNYEKVKESVQKETVQNYDAENINEEKDAESDDVFEQYDSPPADDEKDGEIQTMYYDKEDDDDYVYELEESLDQITSLDIIDRIEQSLMDQLQKENSNEDISPNLNCELGSDIDNPWLYYTDDLRPRHLEPPDRPPPPPPLEEEPLSGTDSTHRIKKELWRRRSDFLGLDLQETDDYDIPPPPPSGLEEFLKQEREQTQWLEKRLSLAEAETEISYSSKSTCVDSGKFSNSDYSDYFMEENNESQNESFIHSEPEQWKQNTVEESLYEAPYGSQYETVPEIPSAVIEENIKTPEHKTRQNIQDLGATPKAKIMDSSQWITEKFVSEHKKPVEPIFRATNSNPNYWLAQDEEWRRSVQFAENHSDRRYSMPPVYSNTHPDITVRTWGDREYEYQQNRPRSAIYYKSGYGGNMYDQYGNLSKKELQHTQSLDTDKLMNYETDTLESEVHKCSCCGKGLCEGSAMGIEALRLYFHIECFRCRLCNMQLGNGSCGTDVQVKDNQLYCPSCFTVD